MKLQFKNQPYQTKAVEAVVNCFAGQPFNDSILRIIDSAIPSTVIFEETSCNSGMLAPNFFGCKTNKTFPSENQNIISTKKKIRTDVRPKTNNFLFF